METARPSWDEIAAIVEEGLGRFADRQPRADWTPAEQMAVVLAPTVFGSEIRQLLTTVKDRLPEVDVMLAEDTDSGVLRAFAKEVGVVGAAETAERLLVQNGGLPVARILATSKSLSGGAQNAIMRTAAGRGWDHWSRRMMLAYQSTIAPGVIQALVTDSTYMRDNSAWNGQRWDPIVARLLVENIRRDCDWATHLSEEADRIEKSLAEYTEDTGDTSWQGDEFLDEDPPRVKVTSADLRRMR